MRRLLVLCVLVTLGACAQPPAAPTAPPATPPTAETTPTPIAGKIAIGDRGLYLVCLGEGSPTVILEAGYGGTSGAWTQVQLAAMKTTRVCAYDRANLGSSDAVPVPRTIQDWANDLERLLEAANLPPPYILVGHSFGGLSVRLYAAQHREQVAGAILVEATHPDQPARLMDALPAPSASDSPALVGLRRDLDTSVTPVPDPSDREQSISPTSLDQARAAGPLGDTPLIVISRGQPDFMGFTPEINGALEQAWADLQKDLLTLSTNSRQIIAERSGHMVPAQQPEVVVAAIEEMVMEMRSNR
jgi:pimeloyl-ACP methyl ester carboxylesterase